MCNWLSVYKYGVLIMQYDVLIVLYDDDDDDDDDDESELPQGQDRIMNDFFLSIN